MVTAHRKLHVLVVSYRRADLLQKCLTSIKSRLQDSPIHVWDNHSDGSEDVRILSRAFTDVDWVFSPDNVGYAVAVNRLAERCNGGDMLLLNPDAELVGDLSASRKRIAESTNEDRVAAVSPSVTDPGRDAPFDNARRGTNALRALISYSGYAHRLRRLPISPLYPHRPTGPVGFLSGECLMINADAWADVGPFDERYFLYGEEADWQRRALDRGWRLYLVDEQGAVHTAAGTVSDNRELSARSSQLLREGVDRFISDHGGRAQSSFYRIGAAVLDRAQRSKRRVAHRPSSHTTRPAGTSSDRIGVLFLLMSLGHGGAEQHAVALVNNLDTSRFACHVIGLKPYDDLRPLLRDGQYEAVQLFPREARMSFDLVATIAKYIDDHEISVVVCANEYPMIYATLARRRAKRHPRLVEIFHTDVSHYAVGGRSLEVKFALVYRRLFANFDVVVFVSAVQQEAWIVGRRVRTRRAITIHNGIDQLAFSRSSAEAVRDVAGGFGLATGDYVIGVCAAFRPEKRIPDVVAALRRLVDAGQPAKLQLIGDGPLREEVEAQVDALGLRERVHITGFQSDVRPYLSACDVLVMASSGETFSLAILEAMALELPVVSTDVGGAIELIDDTVTGLLFTPGDIDQLTAHLLALSDSEQRHRMGQAGRAKLEAQFTLARMVSSYERLFDELGRSDA